MNDPQSTELTLYQRSKNALAELREKIKTLELNDNTLNFAAESMAVAKRMAKVLDDERKEKKEPHLRKGQDIDDEYGLLIKPCLEIAEKLNNMIAAFNREKKAEAERQRIAHERAVREAEEKRLAEERRIREEQERQACEAEEKRLAEERRIAEEHRKKMAELEAAANAAGAKQEEIDRQRREAEAARVAEEQRMKKEAEDRAAAAERQRQEELRKAQEASVVAPQAPVEAPKGKLATTFGSVKIKEKWTFEGKDISQTPREWLTWNEKAIMKAINDKDHPVRSIAGIDIFPEE